MKMFAMMFVTLVNHKHTYIQINFG